MNRASTTIWKRPGMGLLKRVVAWLLLCGVFRLLGWNEYTDAISGMHGQSWQAIAGLIYMLFHLLVVFLAPPMAVAGLVILLSERNASAR